MRRDFMVVISVVCLFLVESATGADWPTFRGDNARSSASGESPALPLAAAWTYRAPALPELSWTGPRSEPIEGQAMQHRVTYDDAIHAVAAAGRVYFGSSVDHQVYCVDAKTGGELWTFYTEGPVRLAPTLWQGRVLVGSDDGSVYCLDANDGRLLWRHRVGLADQRVLGRGQLVSRWPVRTGILVEEGVAYVGAGLFPHETIFLAALDANTGNVVWKNGGVSQMSAGQNDISPQGYMLAGAGRLFLPSGRTLPAAFDCGSGKLLHRPQYTRWSAEGTFIVGGARAMLAGEQVFAGGRNHFIATEQSTGRAGYAWVLGKQIAASGGQLFLAGDGHVVAATMADHAKASIARHSLAIQRRDLYKKRLAAEAYREQAADLDRQIAQFAATGVIWKTASPCDGALLVCENVVFAGGQDRVVALDRKDGTEVWNADVDGKARGLALSDGTLLVSTDAGMIHAFAATQPDATASVEIPGTPIDEGAIAAAREIIETTGQTRGFCLVVGLVDGQLAAALAAESELQVIGIDPNAEMVDSLRRKIDAQGLYGHRVTLLAGDLGKLPNYFANLVVSETAGANREFPYDPAALGRLVKPCGGMVIVPQVAGDAYRSLGLAGQSAVAASEKAALLTRGALPDTGSWTHQYADAGNTACSRDQRVRGGLRVLWFGDPGPDKMVNRHDAAMAPLSIVGRMFVQGQTSIMAYDAYNGLFLWERENPGALRMGIFNNEQASNLAACDDALFVAVDEQCLVLDAGSGEVRHRWEIPPAGDDLPRAWAYVGYDDGILFGTSTVRRDAPRERRGRGRTVDETTDVVFAMDPDTGQLLWKHRGKSIMHTTIAVDAGRVIFIDATLTPEQRRALLGQDKSELRKLAGEDAAAAEDALKKLDVRLATALDARTGKLLWSRPVDVTDCTYLGIGGGNLTTMAARGCVVVCGANANGHYWKQFIAGEFSRRRLLVLDAETGDSLWAKDANYRHRPIVVDDKIFAEPWAFDLHSGEPVTRVHPLTGLETPWQFMRPGHHCGGLSAAPNMLFFRSGFTGYYDLTADTGTSHFAGQRQGCWINTIPAGGLVLIPEASAGCVCPFTIAATVVLEPTGEVDHSWHIHSSGGIATPVARLAVNLGAPGDRRDDEGRLWLAYPRPRAIKGLDLPLKLSEKFAPGGRFVAESDRIGPAVQTDKPWLFASAARGLSQCSIPLLAEHDAPARYTVRLYFSDVRTRAFGVKLQGEMFPIEPAGDPSDTRMHEFTDVAVRDNLLLEVVPAGESADNLSSLSGIEVIRQ